MKEKKKDYFPFVCPRCGGELIWQSDFMAHEVSPEYDDDDLAVCTYFTCKECGAEIDIIQ